MSFQNSDQTYSEKGALLPFLKRIFGYALNYPKNVKRLIFWTILVAAADASFPMVLKLMLDNAVVPELEQLKSGIIAQVSFSGVWLYALVFLGISSVQVICIYFFIGEAGRIREFVLYDLRDAAFRKLQKLPFSFYDKNASGWLLTRLTSDTDRVAEIISWGLLEVVWGMAMIFFCLTALLYFSWKLALIVLITIPIMLVASIRVRMLVLKYSREARKVNSEMTAAYSEYSNGVRVTKSAAQEGRVSSLFRIISNRMRLTSYHAAYYTAMYIPLVAFIGSLAGAGVIWWGGNMAIVEAGLSIGILAAAFEYSLKIFFPIIDISMFYARAQSSLSAGERIFSLIDEPLTIKDQPDATDFAKIKGDVRFEGVGFYYQKAKPVLTDFNLHIRAGESVALVGATGEGKSTIINLIARFYEPTSGSLLIDGSEYRNHTINSLRRQIGMVLQTPHLFSGTVRQNLLFGNPDADDEALKNALQTVDAAEFADRLDEEVGEGGSQLSIGEQQLLSFARAILTNPSIFIMDEASSSIDTLSESRIQKSIASVLSGRTSVIIAHRLSTIRNCDRILVISQGQIIEAGTHEQLLALKGTYSKLSH